MTKKKKSTNTEGVNKNPAAERHLAIGILALMGVALSGALFWIATTSSTLPYCADGSSCDLVQSSRWSHFLYLPITLWGVFVYAAIAGCALFVAKHQSRWRGMIFFATFGFAVSIYLNAVSRFELGVSCVYCLCSLALISAIYFLSWRGEHGSQFHQWRIFSSFSAIILVTVMGLHYAGAFDPAAGPENPYMRDLAQHLAASDAKFYGAFWCPHCQQQKQLFGASAKHLPYVECAPNGQKGARATACVSEEIKNYPTWIINGRRFERTLLPQQLARYTRFESSHPAPSANQP